MLLWIPVLHGSAQTQSTQAQLIIAPNKLDFGRQPLNSQSQPVTITITNRGSTPITLEEILSSGIDFPSQNGCGKELAPGASCSIQISFRPAITGERTGILQITASDSPNSHFVPLSGTGQ
jgi:archaellum component FlaF (FlaF/FlaG flagellin family)